MSGRFLLAQRAQMKRMALTNVMRHAITIKPLPVGWREGIAPTSRDTPLPIDAATAEQKLLGVLGHPHRDQIRSAIDIAMTLPAGAAVTIARGLFLTVDSHAAFHIEHSWGGNYF